MSQHKDGVSFSASQVSAGTCIYFQIHARILPLENRQNTLFFNSSRQVIYGRNDVALADAANRHAVNQCVGREAFVHDQEVEAGGVLASNTGHAFYPRCLHACRLQRGLALLDLLAGVAGPAGAIPRLRHKGQRSRADNGLAAAGWANDKPTTAEADAGLQEVHGTGLVGAKVHAPPPTTGTHALLARIRRRLPSISRRSFFGFFSQAHGPSHEGMERDHPRASARLNL